MSATNLTTRELADRIGVSPELVKIWRKRGTGPRWMKLGDAQNSPVRYPIAEVERWEREQVEADCAERMTP